MSSRTISLFPLRDSGATVVGEHKLHIEHCICCLPDDDWSTVTEVHSHPVALAQCNAFLANHPDIKAVEAEDTAGSAEYIAKYKCKGWAAICNASAAKLYGLKVLQDQIQDNKHNYTRFLVVANPNKADFLRPLEKANKSSIVFHVAHEEGSLSKVLTILSFYGINLTKIQSLPVIGCEWEYLFYVDKNDFALFFHNCDVANVINIEACLADNSSMRLDMTYSESTIDEIPVSDMQNGMIETLKRYTLNQKYTYGAKENEAF